MVAKFTRKDFLEALFAEYYKEHKGFIVVRSVKRGDPKTGTRYFPNIEILAKEQYGDERDVYFGICPRERMKPEKGYVRYLVALWADLDIGPDGHSNKKTFFEGPQQAAKAIRGFPRAPSIIVESGRGAHLYWLLKTVTEVADVEKVERLLRKISDHLQCDTEVNLDTVLRLPETMNTKVEGKIVPCDVKFINTNFRYALEDFEDLGSKITGPPRPAAAAAPSPAAKPRLGPVHAAPASPPGSSTAEGPTVDDSLVLDETILDEIVDDMSMASVVTDPITAEELDMAAAGLRPDSQGLEPPEPPQVVGTTYAPVQPSVTSTVLEKLSAKRAAVEISLLGSNHKISGTLTWNENGLIGVESGGELYTIPISSVSFMKSKTV